MSMDGAYSNVGAVVGATYPEMSKILRKLMPHTYSGTRIWSTGWYCSRLKALL